MDEKLLAAKESGDGAAIDAKNGMAARHGHEACVELPIGAGAGFEAGFEAKEASGRTAAIWAATHGHAELASIINGGHG